MKKLNKKGYLTVEIILASSIAFVIAFFLIEITMKLVNKTDNSYIDTLLVTDKALLTKNLRELIEDDVCTYGGIKSVSCSSSLCTITFNIGDTKREIKYDESQTKISYSDLYAKKLDDNLSNVSLSGNLDTVSGYASIKIAMENIFLENDYNVNIVVHSACG